MAEGAFAVKKAAAGKEKKKPNGDRFFFNYTYAIPITKNNPAPTTQPHAVRA